MNAADAHEQDVEARGSAREPNIEARMSAREQELDALCRLFERGPVAVLTGAGISTESGIPDYRGPETRRRARNPIQYREFLRSPVARRRYWARSMLGWPRLRSARPNQGHVSLVALERAGAICGLITQNVDSLHGQAGSLELVELHGALRDTICLSCQRVHPRSALQAELERRNPELLALRAESAPDGDAELRDEHVEHFQVVDCACGGALKPHVVFFGENVPQARVDRAFALADLGAALLVVGSSLAVFSGLRFVRRAARRTQPIAIVSFGETRGDTLAALRVDAAAGPTLSALTSRLLGQSVVAP